MTRRSLVRRWPRQDAPKGRSVPTGPDPRLIHARPWDEPPRRAGAAGLGSSGPWCNPIRRRNCLARVDPIDAFSGPSARPALGPPASTASP
jgi:hypothetical protein